MQGQLQQKFKDLEITLNEQFVAREDAIHGLVLAVLARKHVLFLGPPGTAKTLMVSRIAEAMQARFFRRLLTSFTTPDEIFGAVDLEALKSKGIFRRVTTGKAADSELVLFDEVFKAGSTILNTSLSLMEERLFDNDGESVVCPLISLIGTSNELPSPDDGLDAFYDRFVIKYMVEYMDSSFNFKQMLRSKPSELPVITSEELAQAHSEIDSLSMASSSEEAVTVVWQGLRDEDIIISDRKFRHMVDVMAAESWLNGYSQVTADSIKVGKDILWDKPEDYNKVRRLCMIAVDPSQVRVREITSAATEAVNELRGKSFVTAVEWASTLDELKEMDKELAQITGSSVDEGRRVLGQLMDSVIAGMRG